MEVEAVLRQSKALLLFHHCAGESGKRNERDGGRKVKKESGMQNKMNDAGKINVVFNSILDIKHSLAYQTYSSWFKLRPGTFG